MLCVYRLAFLSFQCYCRASTVELLPNLPSLLKPERESNYLSADARSDIRSESHSMAANFILRLIPLFGVIVVVRCCCLYYAVFNILQSDGSLTPRQARAHPLSLLDYGVVSGVCNYRQRT